MEIQLKKWQILMGSTNRRRQNMFQNSTNFRQDHAWVCSILLKSYAFYIEI